MRTMTAVALVVLLAACSSGGGTPKPPVDSGLPKTFTLEGDLSLYGANNLRGTFDDCAGAANYVDIYRTAVIVVTNEKGKPMWRGSITFSSGTDAFKGFLDQCVFRFNVPAVHRAKGYYLLVARQAPLFLSSAFIVASNYKVRLQLNRPPIPGTNP